MTLPVALWPFGTPTFEPYAWLFTLDAGVMAVLVAWLISTVSPRPVGTLTTWLLLVAVAGTSMAWRYDLWPAVLLLAGIVAAERGRPGMAGIALGAGAMMKIFPIVIVPILLARWIAERDRAAIARLLLGTAAVVVPVLVVTNAFAGGDALHWLTYQLDRGLQIESVGGGFLLLLHAAVGHPLSVINGFSSLQVISPGADTIVAASPIAELVLVVLVWGLALGRFRRDVAETGRVSLDRVVSTSVAVVIALIVTNKVFSIQYIVWFLPLAPLLSIPRRWLVIAIAAVSAGIYPVDYSGLWRLEPLMIVVLNLRNGLLIALLGWLAWSLVRDAAGSARSSHPGRTAPMTHGTP